MADAEETVVGGRESWWRRHGLAVALLITAAAISFVIRVLYAYPLISTCDISYCYAGGSDSFYHSRVMEWIIGNHTNLVHDPLLNYPVGSQNPREPLFDWMNAILGILLAPFFGGDAIRAGMWVLEMQPPFWAAVGVFPVYLIGKEVSSRRMGLLAALLYPLVVGNIESTVATYANYLPFYTFFVLLSAYCYLHTVRLSGTRRWVESFRSPRAIWEGTKAFVREEDHALRWSVFTGVTLGATMFAWQGYTYLIALIMVFMFITVLTERIRRHDTWGAYLLTILSGTIGFLIAMPYYFAQGEFGYWFTVPLLLFFGGLLVLLPFLMLRDSPWVISVPVLLGSVTAAGGALYLYSPYYFQSVLTGQGYFIKNLIFSTVAEAQAPSFDALIVSYGIATFILTFAGLAIFVAYLFIYRFRREHVFMVVFGLLGIYLPISAAKFFLIGSPVFVLLPAEVLLIALDRVGGYPQMRRNLSSLSERGGGSLLALRRTFKLRHLVLGIIILLVVIPNVSWGVDAGIPYNVQSQYSQQIYASLPTVLQTSAANASSFYLGIAGIQTDTPQQYDESGYNWLATQDTQLAPQDRPAFVSWWDYGFQAIDQGKHPSVADNFQEGIDPAGNFLLAQNESLAISYMTADLLESAYTHRGATSCNWGDLMGTLRADGLNTSLLQDYLTNTSVDVKLVANNPSFYGPKDTSNLDALNSMYDAVSYLIGSTLTENAVAQVYQDTEVCTGWSIRYAMADTRLFPTSGSNTGIYYAPVDLTDGVIGSGGIPTYYFTVTVTGSDGNTYPLGQVPSGVQTVSSQINYNSAFYNSMIYKIEAGYNGSQIGTSNGIPGLTLSSSNPEPGWMMQHFVLGYRTAYYCPYTDYQAHPNCFSAVNYNVALKHQILSQGTSDLSASTYFNSGGETILEYYHGATVSGTVRTYDGTPVPGIRLTIDDSWGYPHMTTVTDSHGDYQLIAPPGNDSIIASYGSLTPLTQVGATQVGIYNITVSAGQGFGTDNTPINPHIMLSSGTIQGQVYWNKANQSTFQATDTGIPGAVVTVNNGLGSVESATADSSGAYVLRGLPPGNYNVSASVGGFSESQSAVKLLNGAIYDSNIGLHVAQVHGRVLSTAGQGVSGATVTVLGPDHYVNSTLTPIGGNYSFSPLIPGVYTLVASDAHRHSSVPFHVDLSSFEANQTANLTLETPVSVSLQPQLHGLDFPNLPVRFTALGGGANGSYVFQTGADGWVHATIPAGNWSVYVLGVVNGTYVAGVEDLDLSPSGSALLSSGPVLPLGYAEPISGVAYLPGSPSPQADVTVTLQDSNGALITTTTGAQGSYRLWLPEGTYAVMANYSSGSVDAAAMAGATIRGPTVLDLSLSTAVPYQAKVGYLSPQGAFQPLSGVPLNLTFLSAPATIQLISGPEGNISLSLPETSGSFQVSSSTFGFSPYHRGPISESALTTTLSRIALNISTVPVNVVVYNTSLASSAPQVNFTGLSPSAQTLNVTGTNVTFDLYPGLYEVSAWAPLSHGGVLRPFTNLTMNVPIGSTGISFNFTLNGALRYRVNATTYGVGLSSTRAELQGGLGTLTYNGTTLLRGFDAAPGTYNLWATGKNGSQPVAFFDPITLFGNGTATPHNVSLLPAGTLDFTMRAPWGQTVNAALGVSISNGNGTEGAFTTYAGGNATLVLPRGGYTFHLNTTVVLNVSGVTQYWSVATDPASDTCAVAVGSTTSCSLVLNVTRALDTVDPVLTAQGSLISGGHGTITVIPHDGGATSVFDIVGGSAQLSLLPGSYTLYTLLGSSGVPQVNITTVTFGYSASAFGLPIALSPGWVQTLGILPPSGLPDPGKVTLVFSHLYGPQVTLQNVSVGSYPLVLPNGAYSVSASASVAPYGPTVPLSASANVTVRSANSYFAMPLIPQWVRTVSMTLIGGLSTVAANGGTVSYQVVVNDTGNAPFSVHAFATPTTWPSKASPSNFTLGTARNNRTQVVEFSLTVPMGQSSTAPSLVLQADLAGTTNVLGSVTAPITIIPTYGIEMGATASFDSVTGGVVTLGFHVGATGNTADHVALTIQNVAEISQDGWTYALAAQSTGSPILGTQTVTPASAPFQGVVELFPHSPAPIFPSSVVVVGVDPGEPQVTGTAVLTFTGHALLGLNSTAVVTGPSVGGTPPPDYNTWLYPLLAFLPAVAIVVGAGTWRWWRTRRWVRR